MKVTSYTFGRETCLTARDDKVTSISIYDTRAFFMISPKGKTFLNTMQQKNLAYYS